MYNLDEWYKYTKLYVNDYPYWIHFNGHKNTDFDIQVVERPSIPQPKMRIEYLDIPGRDGTITISDGTYKDIEIRVLMNYIVPHNVSFMTVTRTIKQWLTGSGELRLSDDQGMFYKVKNVELDGDITRILRRAGTFTALFTCDPFVYLDSGKHFLDVSQVENNLYMESHPVYKITGNGDCTLIVNNNKIEFKVSKTMIIDTDLMLMYKDKNTMQKAKERFDYKDFYIKPGVNEFLASNKFTLKIQPNWRLI